MRLLHTKTLEFHEFHQSQLPKYAILSHTWRYGKEVSLQEMLSKDRELKKGFAKIKITCSVALMDDLDYAWVDTCCIDKSSSAELSEAINCMYQWYSNAKRYYIYLDNLLLAPTLKRTCPITGGLPEVGRFRNCLPQIKQVVSDFTIRIGITEDRSNVSRV